VSAMAWMWRSASTLRTVNAFVTRERNRYGPEDRSCGSGGRRTRGPVAELCATACARRPRRRAGPERRDVVVASDPPEGTPVDRVPLGGAAEREQVGLELGSEGIEDQ
jgi:hypothetical protein